MEGGAADRNHSGEGQGGTHTTGNHRGEGGYHGVGGGEGGPSSAAPYIGSRFRVQGSRFRALPQAAKGSSSSGLVFRIVVL